MVDDPEGEHKVEAAQVIVESGRIADAELGTVAEPPRGALDVALARVDADVRRLAEVAHQVAGPTAEVEHARARVRPHVLADEGRTAALAADEPLDQSSYTKGCARTPRRPALDSTGYAEDLPNRDDTCDRSARR